MVRVVPVSAMFGIVPIEGIRETGNLLHIRFHDNLDLVGPVAHLLLAMDSTGHICDLQHEQKYLKLLG